METLSFGSLSKWFSNTKENNIKAPIAKNLGFPKINLLDSVLHALTNVRNICAHHGRLWNRKFTTQIPFIKQLKNELVVEHGNQTSRKLYNYLVIIIHIMHHINNGSSWRDRVKEHIKTCNLGVIEMGFPNNWENSSIWN